MIRIRPHSNRIKSCDTRHGGAKTSQVANRNDRRYRMTSQNLTTSWCEGEIFGGKNSWLIAPKRFPSPLSGRIPFPLLPFPSLPFTSLHFLSPPSCLFFFLLHLQLSSPPSTFIENHADLPLHLSWAATHLPEPSPSWRSSVSSPPQSWPPAAQ